MRIHKAFDKIKDEFELYAHHDPAFINNPKTFNPIAYVKPIKPIGLPDHRASFWVEPGLV